MKAKVFWSCPLLFSFVCVPFRCVLWKWLQVQQRLLTSTWRSVQQPWQRLSVASLQVLTSLQWGALSRLQQRSVLCSKRWLQQPHRVQLLGQLRLRGSLALVVCQVVTLSGILVFVFSVFAGCCWAIARVSRRRSLEPCASGDVLGLRLLGSCDIRLMSQRCVHDDASEDAQAFDEAHPGAVDKLCSGGEFSSAAAALNYDVVLVERNSVLDDGWEVGHHTDRGYRIRRPDGWTSLAVCRSLQQLRKVPQCASLPSTQKPRFWAREVCTMCRTSLSSSVPSPVRRWSPILMSSCPTSVLASLGSLAFLSVTSTSLIKDGSWWMRTP